MPDKTENLNVSPESKAKPKATVTNTEYDGGTAIANADVGKTSEVGWDVGNRAPSTKYVTRDGKVVDEQPESAKVLIQEGDVITESVARTLKG